MSRGILEVMAGRGWLLAVCGVLVWLSVSMRLPAPKSAPVYTAYGGDLVPPSVRDKIRAERLREEHNIVVLDVPADTAPLPPAPIAPVVFRVATLHPVIFITIDDGAFRSPEAAHFLAQYQIPVTAFLTIKNIEVDYNYFRLLQRHGTGVQNHTLHHPHMPSLPPEQQRAEICHTSDILAHEFHARPTLFRPPYGEYNWHTQEMTAACGMKAVVWWSATMNGGHLQYQPPATHLMPGDIVLLHFRPDLHHDLEALVAAARAHGLGIARLEDYVR